MGGLVDAHRPNAHGFRCFGVDTCHDANAVFINPANVLGGFRVVVRHQRTQCVNAVGVFGDVIFILQALFKDHMHHRVEEHGIGTGGDRQVDVGKLRKHGDARINHNEREFAFFQRLLEPPVNDRVLFWQIRAERH